MTTALVVVIGRELLMTALLVAAPTVVASLVVGLLISVFQTVTSIQEQTLNFAPRILAVSAVLMISLPWTLKVLTNFTVRMLLLAAETGP
jgi:flagellar biosynthetic protein FliQ